VLRYQNGQKYDSHWDWFDERDEQDRAKGNRVATVLMYLSGERRRRAGEAAYPPGLAWPGLAWPGLVFTSRSAAAAWLGELGPPPPPLLLPGRGRSRGVCALHGGRRAVARGSAHPGQALAGAAIPACCC
jgi:hypothetical protein